MDIQWLGNYSGRTVCIKRSYELLLGKMIQPLPSTEHDTEVEYFNSASVQWHGVEVSPDRRMWASPAEVHKLSVRSGDLLICEGGDVGRSAIYGGSSGKIFQNSVHRARSCRGSDVRYLKYLLTSLHGSEWLDVLCNKATIRHLTVEKLGAIEIPWVSVNEQRRIADFLDAETARIQHLLELRASQMQTLSAHMQSHLSETARALIDRYGNVRVRHVLQKIEQGWSPQCEDRIAENGEWGVVKAGCVNGGVFDAAQHKTLPADVEPELRYQLHAGDLLMSRASGSVDLIGSIAVLPDGVPQRLLLCDKVYRLRMDRTRMIPKFVAFMLRTLQAREQIKLGISGAEGMANNLPTATVTNLRLPNAPLCKQEQIVSDLNDSWRAIRDTEQTLTKQLALLAERRQALITAAVTGEIDVTTVCGGIG